MKITLNLILWSVWLKHFSHFSIKHGGIREPDKNLEFKGMVCHSWPQSDRTKCSWMEGQVQVQTWPPPQSCWVPWILTSAHPNVLSNWKSTHSFINQLSGTNKIIYVLAVPWASYILFCINIANVNFSVPSNMALQPGLYPIYVHEAELFLPQLPSSICPHPLFFIWFSSSNSTVLVQYLMFPNRNPAANVNRFLKHNFLLQV